MADTKIDRRGWVRHSFRFPAGPQREALKAANVKIIYEESKAETLNDFMTQMRHGMTVVVDGLHRLARSKTELGEFLDKASAKKVKIEDARTGVIVDSAAFRLLSDAFAILAGEARLPSHAEAVRRGRKGGAPKKEKMARNEAVKIWRDVALYPTAEDAVEKMPGWSVRQAYRAVSQGGLGPRGAPAGRKRKH